MHRINKTKGYEVRAQRIKEITEQFYEPGRQDRCLKMVWRGHIFPQLGITYHTYLRYIRYLKLIKSYDHGQRVAQFRKDALPEPSKVN